MGGDGERRRKKDRDRDKDRQRERDPDRQRDRARSRGKDRKERKKDVEVGWLSRLLGNRICGCSQVSICATNDKVDPRDARSRRAEKEKAAKEARRRHRNRDPDDVDAPRNGCDVEERQKAEGVGPLESTAEDDGMSERLSDRSYTESCVSDTESCRSGRSGKSARSARSVRSARPAKPEPPRQQPKPSASAESSGVPAPNGVKVVSLADLRGQGLPDALGGAVNIPALPKPRQQDDDEEPPQSARSGRSEARSVRSEAQSEGGCSVKSTASVSIKKYMGYLSERKSPAEVKKMVKEFVRQMVKGREMGVLCADGTLKPVMCGLTRSLDTFKIKSGEQTRKVKLSEVERIVFGNPEDLNDLETPLDETCSTMELESSECISFKFAERKAAELFTLCMQLFTDGQRAQ